MSIEKFCVLLLALVCYQLPVAADQAVLATKTKMLTIDDGSTLEVEAGELLVPESRQKATSHQIRIPFYRLRTSATEPAAPIFMLAGGPGSSWLERSERAEYLKELLFYRSIADVIIFDQRGGGRSQPELRCPQLAQIPVDRPLNETTLGESMRALLSQCRDHWLREGVDLTAYNTDENAADVDALRQALGYRKMSLVGGSYGSHLALHLMRRFASSIDRVVLYGIEGPDHTWDNPAGRLATLQRIAADAERAGVAAEGELLQILARVIKRLESQPVLVKVRGDAPQKVLVDAFVVRWVAGHHAGKRNAPMQWPELIRAMDKGDFSLPAQAALALRKLRLDTPMHYSMDCASGISEARRERYRQDAATMLLGNINIEYELACDLWPHRDLGASFRENVISSLPTVIFHGDWDTSTPIENAREVAASLSNAQLVEVRGGSHGAIYNLYARWPSMHERLRAFLQGKSVSFPGEVAMPPVDYSVSSSGHVAAKP